VTTSSHPYVAHKVASRFRIEPTSNLAFTNGDSTLARIESQPTIRPPTSCSSNGKIKGYANITSPSCSTSAGPGTEFEFCFLNGDSGYPMPNSSTTLRPCALNGTSNAGTTSGGLTGEW